MLIHDFMPTNFMSNLVLVSATKLKICPDFNILRYILSIYFNICICLQALGVPVDRLVQAADSVSVWFLSLLLLEV